MSKDLFTSNIDVVKLVHTLAHDVPQGASGNPDSNPQWTISVRDVLHKLGNEKGFKVESRRTKNNPDCHEWLYDVVWLRQPPHTAMEFAAESEWGDPGSVQDDFQKLLCIKAPVKLLLFAFKKESNSSIAVWDGIRNYLNDYPHHLSGETYVFMEFHADSCRFVIKKVEKTGPQSFDLNPEEISAPSAGR
jgi:hypothetical protein